MKKRDLVRRYCPCCENQMHKMEFEADSEFDWSKFECKDWLVMLRGSTDVHSRL